ncbi:MAG: hypothetical protein DRH21_00750 [Deltaproteobacteria bacterium]|nr:MAG: hypothetical protein DRH21_00750 [Deltaproteobacteria bacterium]
MEEPTNKDQDGLLKSNNESEDTQRPNIITIMCALYIFGSLFTIIAPFSEAAWSIGFWYPPYLAFSAVISLICIYGFWEMKKWSIMLYLIFIAVNQLVIQTMGLWTPASLIIPSVVVIVVLSEYRKMS